MLRKSYTRTASASAVASQRPVGSMVTAWTGAGVRTNTGRVKVPRGGAPGRPIPANAGNGCHTSIPCSTARTKVRPSAEAAAAWALSFNAGGRLYWSGVSSRAPGGPDGGGLPGGT